MSKWFSGNSTALRYSPWLGDNHICWIWGNTYKGPPFLHISRKVKIWMQRATVGSGVGSGSKIDAEKKKKDYSV